MYNFMSSITVSKTRSKFYPANIGCFKHVPCSDLFDLNILVF